MRKKKPPEHVNHERWLVSYADFITLLFAFFVVMFAVSQVDANKMGRFTQAFSRALGITLKPLEGESMFGGGKIATDSMAGPGETPSEIHELEELRAVLTRIAKASEELRGLQIIERRDELVLRLPEAVVFDTGAADVKPSSLGALETIASELGKRSLELRIEGHTDNRPIRTDRFRSNWELSTSRAIAVMLVMVGDGLPKARVSVAGYSQFRPVASNDTDPGRRQNRRVDLVVTVKPAPPPPSAAD